MNLQDITNRELLNELFDRDLTRNEEKDLLNHLEAIREDDAGIPLDEQDTDDLIDELGDRVLYESEKNNLLKMIKSSYTVEELDLAVEIKDSSISQEDIDFLSSFNTVTERSNWEELRDTLKREGLFNRVMTLELN